MRAGQDKARSYGLMDGCTDTLIEIIERIKVILNPSGKKAYFLRGLLIVCSAGRKEFDKNGQQQTIQDH